MNGSVKKWRIIAVLVIIIGLAIIIPRAYYCVGNRKFENEIKEMKKKAMLNFSIKTPTEHKTLLMNGDSIHYFVSGNPNGETIIFLHPAFGDHRCFDKQVDYFSSQYKVITLDMPGHGLTGVGKSKIKVSATPQLIVEMLNLENTEKVHIAGVSLGSLLAQYFALKYPERVLSLTVLGGYNINKEQKAIAKAQRKEIFRWLFKMIFSMDAFRRYVALISVADKTEQARFYQSAKCFTRKSFTTMSGLDRLIANRTDVRRTFPLLLLAGENDLKLAVNTTKQWHKDDLGTKMFIVENAGHCANMDNADRFNEIMLKFLKSKCMQ